MLSPTSNNEMLIGEHKLFNIVSTQDIYTPYASASGMLLHINGKFSNWSHLSCRSVLLNRLSFSICRCGSSYKVDIAVSYFKFIEMILEPIVFEMKNSRVKMENIRVWPVVVVLRWSMKILYMTLKCDLENRYKTSEPCKIIILTRFHLRFLVGFVLLDL